MQILIGFIISIGLISGFQSFQVTPKEETPVVIPQNGAHDVTIYPLITPLSEIKNKHIVEQQHDYSCGSAALATLLNNYLGENFTERQVIKGLMQHGNVEKIKKRRAFSLLDMKSFVNVLGYEGMGYKGSIEDLKGLDVPCIVPIKIFNYRHFVVLKGIYKGRVFIADPWKGNCSYTLQRFRNMWYDNVLFMVEPDGKEPLDLLQLSREDLRYIDAYTARLMIYDESMDWTLPVKRDIEGLHMDYKSYKR